MAKYKNTDYYLNLFRQNKEKGISYNKISQYLIKNNKNRFDSNITYNDDYIKKVLKEGIFDPNIFDAIIFCSKLEDLRHYFSENIIDENSWAYRKLNKYTLLKRINKINSGTKK